MWCLQLCSSFSGLFWLFEVSPLCSLDTWTKVSPTPRPLHLIFPLPGMFFPDLCVALLLHLIQVSAQISSLYRHFLITFWNKHPLKLSFSNQSVFHYLTSFFFIALTTTWYYINFYLLVCLLSTVPTKIVSSMKAGALDRQCLKSTTK